MDPSQTGLRLIQIFVLFAFHTTSEYDIPPQEPLKNASQQLHSATHYLEALDALRYIDQSQTGLHCMQIAVENLNVSSNLSYTT